MTLSIFADRYNADIANTMVELGNDTPGLPAYLGVELLRFEPGKLWARATFGDELLTPSGNAHGGALAAILDHATGAVVYPLMPPATGGRPRSSSSTTSPPSGPVSSRRRPRCSR